MRYLGIHYDIGTTTIDRGTTRPKLDKATIEREIGDIATGLHANAVRITGVDMDQMQIAGEVAAGTGWGSGCSRCSPTPTPDHAAAPSRPRPRSGSGC